MRRSFGLISLVFSLFIGTAAQAAGVFTITDVSVMGDGTNSREAKDNAVKEGEKRAFQQLLERITTDSSKDLWPKVDAEKVGDLVQEMGVDKEKVTSTHYEAVLDITFNQDKVEKLLQDAGVSYTDKESIPTLLLPIMIKDGEGIIWGETNTWKSAWEESLKMGSYTNFIIPKGDSEDVDAVNISTLMAKESPLNPDDKAKLKKLMDKYGAKDLLVAREVTSQTDGTIAVEVELSHDMKDDPDRTSSKFYGKADTQTAQEVMQDAADKIIDNIDRKWKQEQETSREDKNEINVNMPVKGLSDWNEIRKQLESFDFVEKVVAKYVTVEFVSVDLYFQKGYEDFVQNLASNGLYIEKRPSGLFLRKNEDQSGWFEPSKYNNAPEQKQQIVENPSLNEGVVQHDSSNGVGNVYQR